MGFGVVITSGDDLAAMPEDILRWLVEARVELELSEPARFALRFEDDLCEGEPRVQGADEIAANRKIGLFVPEGDELVCLVLGPVTEIKSSSTTGGAGSWVEVHGESRLVEMDRVGVQATYTGLASAAAASILQAYGFTADCQDTLIEYDEQRTQLSQRGTDLAFLQEIARRNNMELWIEYEVRRVPVTGAIQLGETARLRTSPERAQQLGAPAPPVLRAPVDRLLRVNPPRGQCPSVTKFEVDIDYEKPTAAEGFTIGEDGAQKVITQALPVPDPLALTQPVQVEGVERSAIAPPAVTDQEAFLAQDALVTEQSWFVEVRASASLEQAGFVPLPHRIVQVSHAGPKLSGTYQVTEATFVVTATDALVDFRLRANGLGGSG
ncbi:hypothetical protein ABC977_17000 [Thioalkalicoccus limnaeus]|uniref:Uncharacterized protein n=1 Tax=Thioalkalicoccus limnaeus TaxID=120681 RepID=A0ABV4BJF8_9GAMM